MNTVTKVLDDTGKPIGIASTERDITERKREAENLRRMATIMRDSNDAIVIQDVAGKITAWNRGAELMFGYGEQEALDMKIWQLAPPNKAAEQKDFYRRLLAGEKVTSFETQRLTKDGRLLDVWLTVTELVDDAGKPIAIASTERDITEHKRVTKEIEAVAKFPAENPNPVLRIARDGALLYVNEAGASQLHEWHLQVGQVVPPMLRERGIPLHRFVDSGLRHAMKHLRGDKDEPHLAMACWNFLCCLDTQMRIEEGLLPAELNDLPYNPLSLLANPLGLQATEQPKELASRRRRAKR